MIGSFRREFHPEQPLRWLGTLRPDPRNEDINRDRYVCRDVTSEGRRHKSVATTLGGRASVTGIYWIGTTACPCVGWGSPSWREGVERISYVSLTFHMLNIKDGPSIWKEIDHSIDI